MTQEELKMLAYMQEIECFLFHNCNTARDRDEVRDVVDSLNSQLIRIIGIRHIKESKKNAT